MVRRLGVACLMLLSAAAPAPAQDTPRIPLVPQAGPLTNLDICGGTRGVTLRPIIATHTQPPYPAESVRLGEQGTTTLRVQVSPGGTVADDSVLVSSGSARLDDAALAFVKQTYRWEPLSCKTPAAVQLRIVWAIHSPVPTLDPALVTMVTRVVAADPADWPDGAAKVAHTVGAIVVLRDDGTLPAVVIIRGSGDAAIDQKSVEVLHRHRWQPSQIDGRTIGGFLFITLMWNPVPGQAQAQSDSGDLAKLQQQFGPGGAPAR